MTDPKRPRKSTKRKSNHGFRGKSSIFFEEGQRTKEPYRSTKRRLKILETLRYPEIGVRERVAPCFFHFPIVSSILPGRPSLFPGVDTSLPVEEFRVREYKLQNGEPSKFRHFKYNCKMFDSLAMLL